MLFMFIGQAVFMTKGGIDEAASTLAKRCGQLIEWNIINYNSNVGSLPRNLRPATMNGAIKMPDVFRLSDMYTTFSFTLKTEMRMMFLSMPIAQEGLNGVIPPRTLEIQVVDRRGY